MRIDFMSHVDPLTELGVEPLIEETPNVFDLEIAKSKMNAESIKDLFEKAEAFYVESDEEAKQGVSLAMQSRKLYNAIEKTRKEIVRPHLDFQRAVKEYADGFSGALKKIEKGILSKVEGFQKEKEKEAARLHAIKVKKEQEERKRIEEANKKTELKISVPTVPTPAPYIAAPQRIAVEDGTSTTENVWKFEVNDASIVPREYLIIDDRAIKQSIKAGIRSIPGVTVYSEQVKRYRVAR
ncbi:hypothetical protein OAF54_02040 [bacterium]|nr:hypothetical protein [bacterium]